VDERDIGTGLVRLIGSRSRLGLSRVVAQVNIVTVWTIQTLVGIEQRNCVFYSVVLQIVIWLYWCWLACERAGGFDEKESTLIYHMALPTSPHADMSSSQFPLMLTSHRRPGWNNWRPSCVVPLAAESLVVDQT
jgi:hypothetical protein